MNANRLKVVKKFELNLKSNVVVSFFAFLLFSTLVFNGNAKDNDEKNAISKELEYLSKGIKYDNSKSNNEFELATKKENKQEDTLKKNAINKELEYLSKGIKYDYSENNNELGLATKKENDLKSTSDDNESKIIKDNSGKNNNKIELINEKIDKPKNTSKDNEINKELAYLNKNTNYKNKLKGQIYLRTDVGILKSQTNVYNANFCSNNCDNKSYDAGKNYNFGIGWYINNDYRLDLLFGKANLKFDYKQQKGTKDIYYKHKVDISTLMLNLYRYKSISKYFDYI